MLWQFQERVELIKGFILKMSPLPNRAHQTISQNVNFKIYSFIDKHRKQIQLTILETI